MLYAASYAERPSAWRPARPTLRVASRLLPQRTNYDPSIVNRYGWRAPAGRTHRDVPGLVHHFYGPHKPWQSDHVFHQLWPV